MALKMLSLAALLAGVAADQMLTSGEAVDESLAVVETFSLGSLAEDAPEWCKNETQLTWKQRKERMQQHATLDWAKKQVHKMREENGTIPEWMEKIVTDDENRGRLKWAVEESKRLKAEGKEVQPWMAELVLEDEKWANRWAACKVYELKQDNQEVPSWMTENARKGIMDYASEKAAEIQEQIEMLDEEKEKEEVLVQAQGDIELASQRIIARMKRDQSVTCARQFSVLEDAMEHLDEVEEEIKHGDGKPAKLQQAVLQTKGASETMNRILERKLMAIQGDLESVLH